MEHASKSVAGPKDRAATETRVVRATAAGFADNRSGSIVQRALAQAIDQGPQVAAGRTLSSRIHDGSRMVAQRNQLERWFGEAQPPEGRTRIAALPMEAAHRQRTTFDPRIQARLEVGAVDDPAERQADEVARRVVSTLGRGVRPAVPVAATIRRRAMPSSPAGGVVDATTERALNTARGSGAPMAADVRRKMESAFDADLGHVRIHHGPQSEALNRRLGATAFTLGNDIFFRGRVPDVASPGGQELLAHEIVHTFQQGGAPLSRTIYRDPDEGAAPAEPDEIDGTIEDNELGPEVEPQGWGPPGNIVADRAGDPGAQAVAPSRRRASTPAPGAGAGTSSAFRLSIADLGMATAVTEVPMAAGRSQDALTASPTVLWKMTGDLDATAFGMMQPSHKFEGLKFKLKADKGANSIALSFKVNVGCAWGTKDGGRTDVKSGSASVVTLDTYQAIVADLTPRPVERSWVATRTTYWSKALCQRHEKFHATDERDWVTTQGRTFLVNYLAGKSVTLSADERKSPTAVKAKLAPVMTDARNALANASDEYYMGVGQSYYSRPGEERAFGDGKLPYQELADAVKTRGLALVAAAKKKAPKGAP